MGDETGDLTVSKAKVHLITILSKGPCPRCALCSWAQISGTVSLDTKPSVSYRKALKPPQKVSPLFPTWPLRVRWLRTRGENIQWCLTFPTFSWVLWNKSACFSLVGPLQAFVLQLSPPCHARLHSSKLLQVFLEHVISVGRCLFLGSLCACVCAQVCMYVGKEIVVNALHSWHGSMQSPVFFLLGDIVFPLEYTL